MFRIYNTLFQSDPMAAHCPGPLHSGWHRFCGAVNAFTPQRQSACRDLTIITWNGPSRTNKPNGLLEASVERFGIKPLRLQGNVDSWRNIDKLALTAEALKSVSTPFVMGADSSDVVLFRDPAELLERYRSHFTADLVYGATGSRCWPELPEFVNFESSRPGAQISHGRYWLDAGIWIGRTPFCRQYFAELAKAEPVRVYEYSEQAVVKQNWPRWYPNVQLDYDVQLFQWFNEDLSVMRLERPRQDRQQELLDLVRPLGSSLLGAEVGVFDGWTSEVLLRSLPHLKLWMVDAWKPYQGGCSTDDKGPEYFRGIYDTAMYWTKFAADRRFVLQESSLSAADRFADNSLDFVFVDANHKYEHVREDIFAWWPKVRPGGLLIGHDYGADRDRTGVWGVARAVDEFANANRREIHVGRDGVWGVRR